MYCTLIYFGLTTISDPKYSYIHATKNTQSHWNCQHHFQQENQHHLNSTNLFNKSIFLGPTEIVNIKFPMFDTYHIFSSNWAFETKKHMPKQPMKKIKVTVVKPKISPTLFRLGRWLQCHFQEKHHHHLKIL